MERRGDFAYERLEWERKEGVLLNVSLLGGE
jgi:hypothetical protein